MPALVTSSRKKVAIVIFVLSVHRTPQHIYAQLIDDRTGATLAAASTLDKDVSLKNGGNIEAAKAVGTLIAERGKKAQVGEVKFDRGGFIYHGRVKALADAAREARFEFLVSYRR